ncbi:DUF308 domain-containing protein [Candidatus Saccharibacteria bacterium]|nr:DUF308 domain-containing protein [Candidatus Saccharibacteria bacterium]
MATKNTKSESTGMYTAGFVLGIIGVVFAFIPLMYWVAYILGALALIFGIIGLVKKAEGHKALVATILGAVAIVVGIVMNVIAVKTAENIVNTWNEELGGIVSEFRDDYENSALGKTVDVTIEGYQDINDSWSDKGLVVTIKNISDKTLSFSINIEALDENGNRIDESYVSAESLAPGQSVTKNAFTLSSLDEDVLENATFNIYRATSY